MTRQQKPALRPPATAGSRLSAQPPLFPDFPEVDWGLIFGGGGGGTFVGFERSVLFSCLKPARFDEKSGMPRGDFFFMGVWVEGGKRSPKS
jgi:hypothetical protein